MSGTVAIFGSCISEDWLHFRDFSYDWPFALPPLRQHAAFVGQFGRPVTMPLDLTTGLNDWEQAQLRGDAEKSFLSRLAEAQPSLVIVDLAIDAMCGLIQCGDGWLTDSFVLRRSAVYPQIAKNLHFHPQVHLDIYIEEMRAAAREFDRFIRTSLPASHVVFHQCRYAEARIGKNGAVAPFEDWMLRQFRRGNEVLAVLEHVFRSEVRCDVISLLDKTWLADERHMWGTGGMHLERGYYTRFEAEIRRLLERHKTSGLAATEQR